MPGNVRDGVVAAQVLAQLGQTPVLGIFKSVAFQAFEFDADRVVVAVGPSTVGRLTRMPGPIVAADELPQAAIAAYIEV